MCRAVSCSASCASSSHLFASAVFSNACYVSVYACCGLQVAHMNVPGSELLRKLRQLKPFVRLCCLLNCMLRVCVCVLWPAGGAHECAGQ
jgi:hypothetical protein